MRYIGRNEHEKLSGNQVALNEYVLAVICACCVTFQDRPPALNYRRVPLNGRTLNFVLQDVEDQKQTEVTANSYVLSHRFHLTINSQCVAISR